MPANRLGQLLAEARLRTGTDLAELAARSGGEFTVGELSDLEAGHRVLDDGLIRTITKLYSLDCGPIIPQRAELTIDLDRNLLSASGKALPLNETSRDHVLDRYLSLVYVLRNREPGSTVPLREEDMAILAASLAERSELIEEQLLLAMQPDRTTVSGLVGWFRNRLWVPGSGALVGAVSIGTLVMVSIDGPGPMTSETRTVPEPEPDSPGTTSASRVISGMTDAPSDAPAIAARPDTSAPATDRTDTTSASPELETERTPESIGAAAEALLPFDWQATLPGWTINYKDGNPTFRGLTFPYEKTIDMYVRDDDTPERLAGILAHEIGHALDVTYLDGEERAEWLAARDASDTQWWPDAYASDFQTGAGDFAESFAFWATGDPSSSEVGTDPSHEQLRVLESIVLDDLK